MKYKQIFLVPKLRLGMPSSQRSVEQSINYVDLPEYWRYSNARDYVG